MSVLDYWRVFDLPRLQNDLDVTASEIATRQDESETSRRRLVELSREFKKTVPEDSRKQVAPLLKSFQAEVDSLSRRSKAAETAFLNIYRKVADAPDPTAALEQVASQQRRIDSLQAFEIENKKLKETLAEYNSEFAQVKNQEVTIGCLKEKIREMEDRREEDMAALVQEKVKELQLEHTAAERALQETQVAVATKLGEAEQRIVALQTALNAAQSEVLDLKSKYDEDLAAKTSEVSIVITDLERSNHRALVAEKELELLQESVKMDQQAQREEALMSSSMQTSMASMSQTTMELELAAKEREIAQLVSDVQRLQGAMTKLKDGEANKVVVLEERLGAQAAVIESLEGKLVEQQDYEEMKRELSILKSMEFSSSEEEEKEGKAKTLEALLIAKNRKLQSENTKLRLSQTELQTQAAALQSELSESKEDRDKQTTLIQQLESDLANVRNFLPARTEGEGEDCRDTGVTVLAKAAQDAVSEVDSSATTTEASLLPIISSQRERFRMRNLELEATNKHKEQLVASLKTEVDSLRSDNVKLYEKIKFLQGYQSSTGGTRHDETISKYSGEYEARMDPFSVFSRRERERRIVDLSGPEKATLNMGRFILSSKFARLFIFFYTVFLHLLVFGVLYKLATTSACKRDVAHDWMNKYAQHMQQAHGLGPDLAGLHENG
ncbi:protein CASP-like [Oscarella lobularis]|uniref:protein CASP-like n=1 Tax=Oscarella lobularis TaxID=121494 RepID=UPI0033135D8B